MATTASDGSIGRYYDPTTGQFLTLDPLVATTTTPYVYVTGDPVNEIDPIGLWGWNPISDITQAAHDEISELDTVRHAAAHYADDVVHSSAYTWFNEHLNPAYLALTGYYDEVKVAEAGCGFWTSFQYGLKGAVGLASTGLAATGVEELGGLGVSTLGGSAAGETVSVSAGEGLASAPSSLVRTVAPDESVANVFGEMSQLTYETGLEHALVQVESGEVQLVSGGETGIELGDDVTQVLAHTHPYGLDALGPSEADLEMLSQLEQPASVLLEHGGITIFGPEGTIAWQ